MMVPPPLPVVHASLFAITEQSEVFRMMMMVWMDRKKTKSGAFSVFFDASDTHTETRKRRESVSQEETTHIM
jgi:hypothetical protein